MTQGRGEDLHMTQDLHMGGGGSSYDPGRGRIYDPGMGEDLHMTQGREGGSSYDPGQRRIFI